MDVVSVPSRGLRYLNEDNIKYLQDNFGFRPLSGIKVSELNPAINVWGTIAHVSVPSRGLRYLNKSKQTKEFSQKRFRPLSGIKVSEQD